MLKLNSKTKNKKGAADANPATLFAIITLVVILYIITIPPNYRKDLLSDNSSWDGTNSEISGYDEIFLEKNPGYWSYNNFDSMQHDLVSFNLMEKTDATQIAQSQDIFSKRTAFSNTVGSFEFNIENLKNTDNVYLNYKLSESRGKTLLKVNGQIVKEISSRLSEDVAKIDKNILVEGKNKITFESNPVGFKFWDYNSLKVSELKVLADITDDSGLIHSQSFWLSHDEKLNLKDGFLRFYVDCEPRNVGPVTITINSNKIYSGIPDCQILNVLDNIDPALLSEGENIIKFEAKSGRFIFDTILLQTNYEENINPTYFFDISDEDYEILQTGLVDINLTFTFVNNEDYKELEARLNGHKIGVNTRNREYSVYVNPMDIEKGSNVLEIVPKSSMTIVKVELRGLFE